MDAMRAAIASRTFGAFAAAALARLAGGRSDQEQKVNE